MPGDPEIRIRNAEEADREAVVRLVSLCLGDGSVPRSGEFWRWKHELNPFGRSPALLAEADGEIVGLRAFLRWRLRCGDRDVEAVRAVDTAIHPSWRGRGIFSRLTLELAARESRRGTALVFNTPNRSSGPGYRQMGWERVGRVPILLRPLWIQALLRSRSSVGEGRDAARRTCRLDHLPPVHDLLELAWLDRFLEDLAAGHEGARYRTPLTREFLRWRYGAIPGVEYHALWSGEGRDRAALVFRSRSRSRFREVLVTEILSPAEGSGARSATELLRELASSTDADYIATVASPGSPERAAALRAGFVPVPFAGPSLFVRQLVAAPDLPDPTMLANWRLGAGFLEIF